MRKDSLMFHLMRAAVLMAAFIFLTSSCFAQPAHLPTSKQEKSLNRFLQDYLKDLPDDIKKMAQYFSAFVDLRDNGTQQVIVFFTNQQSCGSSGCTALILTPKGSSYRLITSISIARPPIRVLASKSKGWHDITVRVQGGGTLEPYEAKLSFDGRSYPSNPTVPPAERVTKEEPGEVVVPIGAEGRPI